MSGTKKPLSVEKKQTKREQKQSQKPKKPTAVERINQLELVVHLQNKHIRNMTHTFSEMIPIIDLLKEKAELTDEQIKERAEKLVEEHKKAQEDAKKQQESNGNNGLQKVDSGEVQPEEGRPDEGHSTDG